MLNALPARRRFLGAAALGGLGLSLPDVLGLQHQLGIQSRAHAAPSAPPGFGRVKACIILFSWGGMSHLEFPRLKEQLMPPLDRASAALLDDLASRGTLDQTLVVWPVFG